MGTTGLLHSRHHLVATTGSQSFSYIKPSILSSCEVFPPVDSCWQILMGRNCHIPRWRLIKKQMSSIFLGWLFLSFDFLESSGILAVINEESEIGQGRKEVRV